MKRTILSILITLCYWSVFAQRLPSQSMKMYIEGCNSLLAAIGEKDMINLVSAEKILNKVQLIQYTPFEDFTPVDSISMSVIKSPEIMFTGEYINGIIKNNITEFIPIENPYILRKGESYDFQVWHGSILPESTAMFNAKGEGYCEMLLLWTYSLDDLVLRIMSPYSGEVLYTYGNNYSCAIWNMNKEGEFIFVIENKAEIPQSFVLAIN